MKKSTIGIISVVMGLSFAALLYLQVSYLDEVIKMRKEQFDESVNRSLYQALRNMELDETRRGLIDSLPLSIKKKIEENAKIDRDFLLTPVHVPVPVKIDSSISQQFAKSKASTIPKGLILKQRNAISDVSQTLREIVKERYVYQKNLLDEVVYSILYNSSEKPLKKRLNFVLLDRELTSEFRNNGINIPFHFSVSTRDGELIYKCPDYDPKGEKYAYTQLLFPNDPPTTVGILRVHFPQEEKFINGPVKFIIPALIFTIILLITFIFSIYIIFRQKRLTEIKNDFINNMTHEFKTPISTISLAAQMLKDPNVAKSEGMFQHISGVINDETKRLRFQVEKVLQISMFEKQKITFKKKEVDCHKLLNEVINTFTIKVNQFGGTIESQLDATDTEIFVDEMHFTNVIFNLMDNAVKYKREDVDLKLKVQTWNEKHKLYIAIQDNGIGIKKEHLKKIFDKFYRVHTGNRHDVKGFGLGLAYVKGIIDLHKGKIKVDSELGKGTRFIIILPTINKENYG